MPEIIAKTDTISARYSRPCMSAVAVYVSP